MERVPHREASAQEAERALKIRSDAFAAERAAHQGELDRHGAAVRALREMGDERDRLAQERKDLAAQIPILREHLEDLRTRLETETAAREATEAERDAVAEKLASAEAELEPARRGISLQLEQAERRAIAAERRAAAAEEEVGGARTAQAEAVAEEARRQQRAVEAERQAAQWKEAEMWREQRALEARAEEAESRAAAALRRSEEQAVELASLRRDAAETSGLLRRTQAALQLQRCGAGVTSAIDHVAATGGNVGTTNAAEAIATAKGAGGRTMSVFDHKMAALRQTHATLVAERHKRWQAQMPPPGPPVFQMEPQPQPTSTTMPTPDLALAHAPTLAPASASVQETTVTSNAQHLPSVAQRSSEVMPEKTQSRVDAHVQLVVDDDAGQHEAQCEAAGGCIGS